MFDPNAQNSLLKLKTELKDCCYDPQARDFLSNLIIRIMNYPKKTSPSRHYVKMMDQKKLMMVWYPMSVPFMNRNYNVPIQIYIMKNIPYEPPQIFIEITQGSAVNTNNKDIDPRTNKISTNSLRNWNQYSRIEQVLEEIYNSFSKSFPIYKKKTNQQAPVPNNQGQGGGLYGMLKNEVNNLYQQNYNIYNQQGPHGFQPPTKSIYGRSMTLDGDRRNYNNNQGQPNSFGGGIYGNNNNNQGQPNSFGGGIYGNNNNNQQQPNSFGGGIYGNNNNNNQQQPNSFGGGIYGNNNNNQPQPNSFGGGIYGNNNNNNNNNYNNNQYGGMYNPAGYNAPPPPAQPKIDPDEEFKKILIEEITNKTSNKIIEEKKRLNAQNKKLEKYKTPFLLENEKYQNFLRNQNQIKTKCEEDMATMNSAIQKVQTYINNNKSAILNQDNFMNYLDIPESNAIKIIADETSTEEMILIVKKGFERKKISFEEALVFMRNSARDLFAIKFLKDKMINKFKY